MSIGDYRRAVEVLRGNVAALARSTPGYMRDWCIASEAWLAQVLSLLGEFAEGRRHGEAARRLANRDEPWFGDVRNSVYVRLGSLYLTQGDLEAAIGVFEEGLSRCRGSDQRVSLGPIAGGLGEAYAHTGRLAEGLALLEEARRDDLRTGALGGAYVTHLRQLSTVYLLAGRFDEAWQHACQTLDRARQLKARGEEAHALFQLGAVHAHADPPMSCRPKPITSKPSPWPTNLACGRSKPTATVASARCTRRPVGRSKPAPPWPRPSKLYHAMKMTFWLPQAEAMLAQIGGRDP